MQSHIIVAMAKIILHYQNNLGTFISPEEALDSLYDKLKEETHSEVRAFMRANSLQIIQAFNKEMDKELFRNFPHLKVKTKLEKEIEDLQTMGYRD